MATSLSIDSSPTSLHEHTSTSLASGLAAFEANISAQSKKYSQVSKNENLGSCANGQGASQSAANNSATGKESNTRGNSLSNSTQYQQQSLLSNTGLTYPLLSAPYYGHQFLQSITTPTAQTTASYYSGNTISQQQVSSSQTTTNSGANRRGGKKKAPLAQQQTSQYRIFFNLKKKEVTNAQRGPSHMYKPKNPPSISEWFKKLNVEERINALTTIYPNLTETLINMNKRIEQSGRHHSFALKDPIYYDHKAISPMFYSSSYSQTLFSTGQSSSSQSSFEENFYCREQNETELRTIKITEKEKFEAEQEIVRHVRLTDFHQYLDTLTVAPDLVVNPEHFLKLMINASGNQAFKTPCQFQFDQKAQINVIEAPAWFKPKSFHSFATWIIVALEETLWAHYNQDTNQNLNQAKLNELSLLFKDKSDSPDSDVQPGALAQFWKDMNPTNKKELLEQLSDKATKIPRENLFQLKGKNQSIRTVQSRDFGYQVKIVEFNKDQDLINYEEDDIELKEIIEMASQTDNEPEMLTFLVMTPLRRAEKRQDRLCREFYKCIKQKYQEELVEILLKEEQQQSRTKWGEGKRKKKKNVTQQNEQDSKQQEQQDSTAPAEEQQAKQKKKKNKKNTCNNNHAYSTSEEHKTERLNEYQPQQSFSRQGAGKKKKRNQKQADTATTPTPIAKLLVPNQEAHSCDEKVNEREDIIIKQNTMEPDEKCNSIGKESSQFCDQTTTHQSITTLSNCSSTIKSVQQRQALSPSKDDTRALVLSSSKSVDYKSKNLQILKGHHDQLETIDTQSEEGLDLLKMKSKSLITNNIVDMNINKYVQELTNQMIDEVCQKFESDSSNSKKEVSITKDRNNLEELKQKQKKFNANFYSIGAEQQEQDLLKPNPRKPSFKKKQGKESNQESVGESSLRKSSFSMKIKEDKKFVEDYQQNSTSKLIIQSSTVQMSNELPSAEPNESSTNAGKLNNKGRNPGKGQKQGDKSKNQGQAAGKKNQNNKPQGQVKEPLKETKPEQVFTDTCSVVSDTQSMKTIDNQGQRKKRNRKKPKQNDTDIMNNFMKNLQSQSEDISNTESEAKSSKNQILTTHQSKKQQYQPKNPNPEQKEQVYKQKTSTTHLSKHNSEQSKTNDSSYQPKVPRLSTNQIHDNQKPNNSSEQQQHNSARNYPKPFKHQSHYQKAGGQSKVDKRDDESVNSNQAETKSENGQNYHSHRGQQHRFKPKQQAQQTQPFKYNNPQAQAGDWETTSFTATSNTAEESSIDNNHDKRKLSAGECNILVQDQLSEIPDKIESKALPQMQDHALLQTKSMVYKLNSDDQLVPPTIQSPQSCISSQLSTQAQCFTPKGYQNQSSNNNYYSNQRKQIQTMLSTDYNKNGCQSFQNTPNKKGLQQSRPQFKPSVISNHSHQANETNSQKTPPLKQSPTNHSHTSGNPFRKQSSVQHEIKPSNKGHYKQPHRPIPHAPYQMNTSVPSYYMDQPHSHQNLYYGSQDTYLPPNRVQPSYYHPTQDGVFQYQEQPQMNTGHIQYSPPLYTHHSQQYEYQADNITSPLSQSLTNEHLGFVDQGQDFLYQIFNSLNQVHQPMSPVPMMFAGAPPVMDYQHNLEQELQQLAINMDPTSYQTYENKFYAKFDEDIYAFCSKIQENIDMLKVERQYIFDKINKTCEEVFTGQSPKLVPFGSLSTGLALESSDMDLAVTGLQIEDRYVMIEQLQKLAQALQGWECLVSFKSIDTASIPVIKMKIDIGQLREQELKLPAAIEQLAEDQKILSIDITFDDSTSTESAIQDYGNMTTAKTHLGLQSCQLVQNYVASYQHLKEVALLLKKFLAIHEFNSPYYGGLSSYSTVLLLVAYMNYFGLKNKPGLTPSRLLMGYLDYYGNYFNPSSFGISTYNDGSFYQQMGPFESNFVILDPLNLQNNTTKNSYHTREILQKFQCTFNNLKSLMVPQFLLPQFQNKLKGVLNSTSKDQNMSPLQTEISASAGVNEQIENTKATNEDNFSKDSQNKPSEEKEADSPSNGRAVSVQEQEQPFAKMNLLEIFMYRVSSPKAHSR